MHLNFFLMLNHFNNSLFIDFKPINPASQFSSNSTQQEIDGH